MAWRRAIFGFIESVRASAGTLLAFDPATGRVLRNEDYNVDPGVSQQYARDWAVHDLRLAHGQHVGIWEPMTERTLDIPGWHRSAILNEFLIPVDSPHIMPVWLHKSARRAVTLSLQGDQRRGPFEPSDLQQLARLAPHLSRALEIREQFALASLSAQALGDALGQHHLGALLLDASGRILEANAMAYLLLGSGGPIHRKADGTLSIAGTAGRRILRCLASGLPASAGVDGKFCVPRERRLPLSLTLAPLVRGAAQWFGSEVRWLLTISDPEQAVPVSTRMLVELHGLSEREAEVAVLIGAGVPLIGIAGRLRTSVHTVRAQLKSIFRKTGWHSQSELIRNLVLMSGA